MKLYRIISYGFMFAGAVAAGKSLVKRRRWEQANTRVAIMLDWDDVQAVATRALAGLSDEEEVAGLLSRFKEKGATHLSIPELTLNRLLRKGRLSITQGTSPKRVYLQANSAVLADLIAEELQIRLPHIDTNRTKGRSPVISFIGDLPAVAEVGLGFDPAQADLARQAGLEPVARPIGYSWVQPAMIDRTLNQAAELGAKIVAVQGDLIPGHEFKIQHTVEAMQRNQLVYAYFRESRHQKGDWFLAKHLAPAGLVRLAHEFTPTELLDEDLHTAAYRWSNLAVEAGIRLCSVRFFKVLHAADPLESLDYVQELSRSLSQAGMSVGSTLPPESASIQPKQDPLSLACVGLSTAGAMGLATDLFPISKKLKLFGVTAEAAALGGLPLLGLIRDRHHYGHGNHGHHHHDHNHSHDDDHHHHHNHSHGSAFSTAYAQKGLALAATVAYPAAAIAVGDADPLYALVQTAAVSAAGAATVAATTVDSDYLLGIEEYRGYNLDWLLPLGLVAGANLFNTQKPQPKWYHRLSVGPFVSRNPKHARSVQRITLAAEGISLQNRRFGWLSLIGVALAGLVSMTGKLSPDIPASFDREHRHAHTHHLSQFQQQAGDLKLALSPRPLRKWSLLTPLSITLAAILRQDGQNDWATAALMTAVVGQIATLTGFRQGQRPLEKTVEGRAKGWAIGGALAAVVWLIALILKQRR